jgi:hypothetical protein
MENTHPTPRPAVLRSLYEFRKNIKEECPRGHPIMKDQQQPSQSHWSTSGILISWIGIIGRGRSPAHAADRFRCISLSRRAIGWQVTASMWQRVVEPRAEYARQMQSTLASDDLQWQKSAICAAICLGVDMQGWLCARVRISARHWSTAPKRAKSCKWLHAARRAMSNDQRNQATSFNIPHILSPTK